MDLARANRIWQRSTGILAVCIIGALIMWWRLAPKINIFQWLLWLHLPLLMLHEFEEYVFPGGFKEFFNTKTPFALSRPQVDLPLNNSMVFFINMGAWILIIIGALLAEVTPWLGMMMVVFELINIVGHGGVFQSRSGGYNPGLVTAVLLILPYVVAVFWFSIAQNILTPAGYVLSIIGGIILALSLPVSTKINIAILKKKRRI